MNSISDDHRTFVRGVVALYRPSAKLFVFGSRAKENAKPSSDLDLLIKDEAALSVTDLMDIKEMFKASRLPFSVDVTDWYHLPDEFRRVITNDLKEL